MEYGSTAALGKSDSGNIVNPNSNALNDLGEGNMEATIRPDDVVKAGGLGAKDDIGSFLPVAVDSTDFENLVLKNYEETQEGENNWEGSEESLDATMTTDDITRAGGFGATDDISSVLPVAMDSTDFEASLRDARDYEEPQGNISRPGLGWSEATKPAEDFVS